MDPVGSQQGDVETLESRQRINGPGPRRTGDNYPGNFIQSLRPTARQNIFSFRDDRATSLSVIFLSLFPLFITSWPVSKTTSLVNHLFLFYVLTRTTRRISDSGVTRYAIRSRSEESINPPNECKLPAFERQKPSSPRTMTRAKIQPERKHTITSGDDVYTSGSASSQMQMSGTQGWAEGRRGAALRRRQLPTARS